MKTIVVEGSVEAPIDVVWGLLADARNYQRWAAMRSSALEKTGESTEDGVGAIRRFGTWPIFSREEVVEFNPPHKLSYVLLSGLPVVNYRADVDLRDDSAGTAIRWSASFDVRRRWLAIPMRAFLSFILKDFVRRLTKEAAAKVAAAKANRVV